VHTGAYRCIQVQTLLVQGGAYTPPVHTGANRYRHFRVHTRVHYRCIATYAGAYRCRHTGCIQVQTLLVQGGAYTPRWFLQCLQNLFLLSEPEGHILKSSLGSDNVTEFKSEVNELTEGVKLEEDTDEMRGFMDGKDMQVLGKSVQVSDDGWS
jgi:hypothetical protein